jgi:hypothetical protein
MPGRGNVGLPLIPKDFFLYDMPGGGNFGLLLGKISLHLSFVRVDALMSQQGLYNVTVSIPVF